MVITIREPGSALTHFIGAICTLVGMIPLLMRSFESASNPIMISMTIFSVSMLLLYSASATYHGVNFSGSVLRIFRKLDHMMIFVLIAGTYTPICVIGLEGNSGYTFLAIVWGLALLGMIVKACWITCPKWFSSVIYIAMGWLCVFVFGQLHSHLSVISFVFLFAGGVIYTIGGIIYALKLSCFNTKHTFFGSHEIFHLFVMGGSLCHFICMFTLI